jgi:hypothetical protein
MGEVYPATDIRLARAVAIKTCPQQFGARVTFNAAIVHAGLAGVTSAALLVASLTPSGVTRRGRAEFTVFLRLPNPPLLSAMQHFI